MQLSRRAIEEREHSVLVAGNDTGIQAVEQSAKKLALALVSRRVVRSVASSTARRTAGAKRMRRVFRT